MARLSVVRALSQNPQGSQLAFDCARGVGDIYLGKYEDVKGLRGLSGDRSWLLQGKWNMEGISVSDVLPPFPMNFCIKA